MKPNMRVASHTAPIYEYRRRTRFEQWEYNRRMERNINKLLGKDYTWLIIIISTLVIMALAVVAGVFIVR